MDQRADRVSQWAVGRLPACQRGVNVFRVSLVDGDEEVRADEDADRFRHDVVVFHIRRGLVEHDEVVGLPPGCWDCGRTREELFLGALRVLQDGMFVGVHLRPLVGARRILDREGVKAELLVQQVDLCLGGILDVEPQDGSGHRQHVADRMRRQVHDEFAFGVHDQRVHRRSSVRRSAGCVAHPAVPTQ